MSRDLTSGDAFLARFQTQRNAFRGIVRDDVFQLRDHSGAWEFGQDVIQNAARIFLNDDNLASRIEVALVNEVSMSATWYKRSDEPDSYLIAVNAGLVTALRTIAYDVFGYGDEVEGEALLLGNTDPAAAERVAERVAAFLEIGFPLGNAVSPSPRRVPFVKALINDALRFLVLHEFAHILLRHDRGDVHLLRNRMVDVQIATFSIGQEHQADQMANMLNAVMSRPAGLRFPGMEFAGPSLLFGLLGVFERYTGYQAVFDTPHAHPNAYERLYRLRVSYTFGSKAGYIPVFHDGVLHKARPFTEPNPEAVRFSDAIAQSLLETLRQIETKEVLPSPFNGLFNRYCEVDLADDQIEEFWTEIARWTFLGSPIKVVHHLAELKRSGEEELKKEADAEQRAFLSRALLLITEVVRRMRLVGDYSVKQALQKYADAFE